MGINVKDALTFCENLNPPKISKIGKDDNISHFHTPYYYY